MERLGRRNIRPNMLPRQSNLDFVLLILPVNPNITSMYHHKIKNNNDDCVLCADFVFCNPSLNSYIAHYILLRCSEAGVGNGWTAAAQELGLKRDDLFLQTKYTPYVTKKVTR